MRYTDGKNAKLIKIHNRALVLKIIQQKGNISRKNIAAITGLTQATITKITRNLLEQGLILEQHGRDETGSSSGRKPIGLIINRKKYKIISVAVGRQTLKCAVSDLAGNLICKQEQCKNILNSGRDGILQEIIVGIKDIIQREQLDLQHVLGIGISAPGPINAQDGILLGTKEKRRLSPNVHHLAPFDWRNIPLKKVVQNEFGVEVFADNDANISALAESWFGNGIGVDNFVLYSIGVGIGAGVIIDSMLYRGEDDVVAEIGHTTIDFDGPQCICGNFGCLELYADFSGMVVEYQNALNAPAGKHWKTFREGMEYLFNAAYRGDSVALELIEKKSKFLSIGAVSLANIFSPECLIVASNDLGEIDLRLITDKLQTSVKERAFSTIADKVTVIQSKLGNDIHLYGGVALVLQDFFQMLPTKD